MKCYLKIVICKREVVIRIISIIIIVNYCFFFWKWLKDNNMYIVFQRKDFYISVNKRLLYVRNFLIICVECN